MGARLFRGDGAGLRRRLGSAQGPALRVLRRARFRHSDRQERRQLRSLLHTHGRDAPVRPHHETVPGEAAFTGRAGASHCCSRQHRAAAPRSGEALDGSAHPSFQALHRGPQSPGRRGLCRGRGAKGRVRRLSNRRRQQQTVQVQDPLSGLCPFAGHGLSLPRSHAGRHLSRARLHRYRIRRGRSMSVRRLAEKQPASFAFTPDNLSWAKAQVAKYPEGRQHSAVIPVLWRAQEQCGGWLPQKAIEATAELLGMPKIRVLEVATFYTLFNLAPVGRFHVQLCGTTPCMLRGSEELKKVCRQMIGEENHVTADGTFSWIEVECLGACVNAPMVQINADYYEDLTAQSLTRIINDFSAGKMPKPGPQIDRINSAPLGGPITLTDPALDRSRK